MLPIQIGTMTLQPQLFRDLFILGMILFAALFSLVPFVVGLFGSDYLVPIIKTFVVPCPWHEHLQDFISYTSG